MTTIQDSRTPQDLLSELSKTLQTGDPSKDENTRQNALTISSLLTASLQTPRELAFGTCFLPAYSACCRAGIHLGVFEAIDKSPGSITASELAAQTGSEHLLIVRLLRVITGLGLVSEVGLETYHALPATHAMASPMIRAAHQHFWDQGLSSLLHLPTYLNAHRLRCPTDARDGLFQQAFSTSLDAFSYWQAQPPPRRALDNFNFLMTCIRGEEPAWLSWFPVTERILKEVRPGGVVLVDVGGGRGHDVGAFRRRMGPEFPEDGRVVLEDLPAVLKDAGKLEEGVEMVEYDFFTPQVVLGARIYYYAHILHDWSDEACARILRGTKPAMEPGYSKILLYEFILPDIGCSLLQAGFDIQMMGMHAGMERTRAQWTRLLEGEGFRIVKFWMAPGGDGEGIVEAELKDDYFLISYFPDSHVFLFSLLYLSIFTLAQNASSVPPSTVSTTASEEPLNHNVQMDNHSAVSSAEEKNPSQNMDEPWNGDVEVQHPQKRGMHDPSQFPDGGFAAWLCVGGGFCCAFCSFGWANAIGVFQEFYQRDLLASYSPSTISWIVSLETFFMFFGAPIVGNLYDNFGPRWILLTGTFLHVFGLMMASLSTEYYQLLLAQGICSPLGASAVLYPAMSTVVTWFHEKRALALGIMVSGSSLGGVIFPILVQNLIPQIGFPWTMRVSAFLILGLLVFATFTVRSRIPPTPRPFSVMDFIRPFSEPAFATVSIANFFGFLGLFIPFNFITLSAISLGMSINLSNYLLSILNVGSIFGRIFPGWAADKLGRYNIQIFMCTVSFILNLALWLPARGNVPIIIFAVLYGFASGTFVSLAPAIIAQITSDMRQIGTRTGTMFGLVSFAALIGNPIAGALLSDDNDQYLYLQIFTGVAIAVGTAFFVLSKSLCKGKLLKKF